MNDPFENIMQQHQAAIDKIGFSIQCVFSNYPEDPCFCYTLGLSQRLGAEIIIVAPCSVQILHGILYQTVIDCINKGQLVVGKIESTEYKIKDGTPLRLEIVELDPSSPNANVFNLRLGEISKFYQLYVGDKHNLLPNEEGYDSENWGYIVDEHCE